jgi:hypothetical protein
MTNKEYIREFESLKNNLTDNLAIYHERITLLIKLTVFEIGKNGVNFKAKILKPLNRTEAEQNILYKHMIEEDEISFSANYQFGTDDKTRLLNGRKVGRPYCPFTLWLDPELAKFVAENEDVITKQIPEYILWSKDWKAIKGVE